MTNFQLRSKGVTVFCLVTILSKARVNSLQLRRVMEAFTNEYTIFDLRKHRFPTVLWVGIAMVVKIRLTLCFRDRLFAVVPFLLLCRAATLIGGATDLSLLLSYLQLTVKDGAVVL
jgi:hypothetical protein